MRVIGGEFRSRKLKSAPGLETRPTPDRLREALFNVLAPRIRGVVFLDAYAGTGAVGIEALSRGATRAIFVEKSRAVVDVIRANLSALGLEARAEVFTGRVPSVVQRLEADIVFLDPPYEAVQEYESALVALQRESVGLVIVQHEARLELNEQYGPWRKYRTLKQGSNSLSFYE
jgi:16S rRNA (guanine(966)-N(2))-methyltransferase RsmD